MADPITAVGAAAGIVQLADVALRVSKEAYKFLSQVKNADRDVRELKDALNDTDANMRSLRNYIREFSKSKMAAVEFEVVSPVITRSVTHFHQDIVALRDLMPRKPNLNVAEKIKWAYHRRGVQNLTKRMASRKEDLVIALEIVGRVHDLRLREDNANIQSQLTREAIAIRHHHVTTQGATSSQFTRIDDQIMEQARNQSEMTKLLHQNGARLNAMQADQIQNQDQMQTTLKTEVSGLANHLSLSRSELNAQLNSVHQMNQDVLRSQTMGHHKIDSVQQSIDAVNENMINAMASFSFSASNPDMLERVMRAEMTSTMQPILEQMRSTTTFHNEELELMRSSIDHISRNLGGIASKTEHGQYGHSHPEIPASSSMRHRMTDAHSERGASSHLNFVSLDMCSPSTDYKNDADNKDLQGNNLRPVDVANQSFKFRQEWFIHWKIGTIRIKLERKKSKLLNSSSSELSLSMNFRPVQTYLSLPGITLQYRTITQGSVSLFQLAPSISVYPIIPDDHPIWCALEDGSLSEVRRMICSGEVHPRSQNEDGISLLSISLVNTEITDFLLVRGATWELTHELSITAWFLAALFASVFHEDVCTYPGLFYLVEKGFVLCDEWNHLIGFAVEWVSSLHDKHLARQVCGDNFIRSIRYLKSQNVSNFWGFALHNFRLAFVRPFRNSHAFLRRIIFERLIEPNYVDVVDGVSLLEMSLHGLSSFYERRQDIETRHGRDRIPDEEEDILGTCIIELVIDAGADIYHVNPPSVEEAQESRDWIDIATPTRLAYRENITKDWIGALRNCGLDWGEVLMKNKQIARQAVRLEGAKRTGIDERVLEIPSAVGIWCRRCRKKFCNCARY